MTHRIVIITYDLKTPRRDYAPLFEAIKRQGTWWHYLASTWLVATTKPAKEVYEQLAPYLSKSDNILVIPMASKYWGFMPEAAWEWIKQHDPTLGV